MAEASRLRGSTGKGHIWDETGKNRLLSGGREGERREGGKLFLQHSISLSLPAIRITFFFFSMEIFHKDYRHCREQHRLMAHSWCSFEGHNSSLCPFKAGGVSVFPVETRRSFSVTFSGWAVGALQLCWRPCCQAVTQKGFCLSAFASPCPQLSPREVQSGVFTVGS